ncbi:hypothetical protein [Pseudomonas putida]|uniref:hypothetical protein n=1 Tax=Pseudomonas putida TaxID=303 RepID=UPI001E2C9903|nr:hypothetical protein [Pseudomonas putida]MCE0881289.1 hypothetical protein [Pseudomonas putida]
MLKALVLPMQLRNIIIDSPSFIRSRPPFSSSLNTASVSHAVFNAAYKKGLTSKEIKRIWRLAGDNFDDGELFALFTPLATRTDIRWLQWAGCRLLEHRVLMNGGRKCVAVRILDETLHRTLVAQSRGTVSIPCITEGVSWSTFTFELLTLITSRGLADEALKERCLEFELGL